MGLGNFLEKLGRRSELKNGIANADAYVKSFQTKENNTRDVKESWQAEGDNLRSKLKDL